MDTLVFSHVFAAVLGANAMTGMFLYGMRALIKNEADFTAYLLIIVPALTAMGAAVTVWSG